MVSPYLPDIIQGCVQRVNDAFSARSVDPFAVFFDKGVYSQVSRSVYKMSWQSEPLVWFVMNFGVKRGTLGIYGDATCTILIAMPTEHTFTQQEREDNCFKPRLIPVYEALMQEIYREKWFMKPGPDGISHSVDFLPYWGVGINEGADQPNLFGKYIDAIRIRNLQLKIKLQNCSPGDYPLNKYTSYPSIVAKYRFYNDMELIVDGGADYDPVSGTNSVMIPLLIGKIYTVSQRGFGELRQSRNIEIIPDEINGGFALAGGQKFSHNDSFFIHIQPILV